MVRPHRLHPPVLGVEDVERPRLSAAIRATAASGTCVVSAPPGYGATTVVAQALAGKSDVAWVALDELDGTPHHLLYQLSAAVTGENAPEGQLGLSDNPGGDLVELMSRLVDRIDQSPITWIVLDGVEWSAHSTWMPALAYLIANVPPRVRLVITTHDAPRRIPVDLADRRLTVLVGDDLLADSGEAAAIALAANSNLDIESLEEITAAAQGWIAAICTAARYAAQHPDGHVGHWLVTQGAVSLADPWLRRLSSDRMDFLLATVFLERLCAPLCDVTMNISGSQVLLDDLESLGSYLIAVSPGLGDGGLRWWRRHPLVTAALLQGRPTVDDPEGQLRAAEWFENHGDLESTMRHLLAAGRLDRASELLRTHEISLFESGRADRLSLWYASLPPDAWGQVGWHLLRVAWGHALGALPSSADLVLAQLRAHLATSPPDEREERVLQAETATLTAYLASLAGDTTSTIANAGTAIELFGEENPENSQQIAAILLARAHLWEGNIHAARRELNRLQYEQFNPGILRDVAMKAVEAQCLTDEGRVTQSRREIARAMAWLDHYGLDPLEASQFVLLKAEGSAVLESGDARSALTLLEACADGALAKGAVGDAVGALVWQAHARVTLGQLGDALACVHRARRLLQESTPTSPILHRIDLTEALIRYAGGDTVRAERLIQRVPASDARTLMWARVTAHRQGSGVRRLLAAVESETPRVVVEKQLILALVALKRGPSLAEGHLIKAADTASANGMMLALVGYPTELLDTARAVASRSSHDGLGALVDQLQVPIDEARVETALPRSGSGVSAAPLSPGELELITFLPGRDSNAEIARQLGVSVNTVKTRLYRLYRKLGVDSRDGAISQARARGILL